MDERRSPRAQEPVGHPRKQRRNRTDGVAKGILMTVLTLMLVGVCTVAMLFGIFMKYVNTSLLPTLDVKAEDYTIPELRGVLPEPGQRRVGGVPEGPRTGKPRLGGHRRYGAGTVGGGSLH